MNRNWLRAGLITVVCLCFAAIALVVVQLLAPGKLPLASAFFPTQTASSASPADAPVTVLDAAAADGAQKAQLAQRPPSAGQPLRVQVPDLGLDVPVVAAGLNADRQFNPPSNVLAYWMRDFGSAGPSAKNTVYLAAHSWNNGYAAFNRLMDQKSGTSTAKPGQKILVNTPEGAFSYSVTAVADYAKSSISAEPELWQAIPGRLVLLTCFQLNDAGANRNLVIYAQIDSHPASPAK